MMGIHGFDKDIVAALLFFIIAFIALTLPDHPDAFSFDAFFRLPVEVLLVGLALLLAPQRLGFWLAIAAVLIVGVMLFLKIADIGVQSAFQRQFNPYLDTKMLVDGWRLLRSTIGTSTALLTLGGIFSAFCLILAVFYGSAMHLAAVSGAKSLKLSAAYGSILVLGVAMSIVGPLLGFRHFTDARALPYFNARLTLVASSIADMHRFEQELAAPQSSPSGAGFLGAVRGRDVVLIFVESYGRSAIEDPRYSPVIRPRLEQVQQQLNAAGFASASGWSLSPTVGGISWLAHGTFLSGLWIDSQARYDRLMMSDWPSLNRLFQQAGWRTAAVMPAITMDWPDSSYFGYDQVLASKNLGYRGKPFNWVTMPDQYTLSAFDRMLRRSAPADGKPVMAEIALISSHAPWTPVPKLIDWADVGDGTAFNTQAASGDTPTVVWADHQRVRLQYIQTIDYSLQTISDYIAHFGDDALFIILGDHQPASLITGSNASRSVPVHIISRDQSLIERFQAEGFNTGILPKADAPELQMDTMRNRLLRVFSAE
jgi:hypothetical protein